MATLPWVIIVVGALSMVLQMSCLALCGLATAHSLLLVFVGGRFANILAPFLPSSAETGWRTAMCLHSFPMGVLSCLVLLGHPVFPYQPVDHGPLGYLCTPADVLAGSLVHLPPAPSPWVNTKAGQAFGRLLADTAVAIR